MNMVIFFYMVKYFLQVFLNIFIERELKKIFKDEPFDCDISLDQIVT